MRAGCGRPGGSRLARGAANRLPGARSFKDTSRVLATTRSTCAWAALGHATAAYDAALRYALERRQFGESLASFQIIQQRLVSMLADLTAMQLYCLQIGRLAEAGRLTPTVAGLRRSVHLARPHFWRVAAFATLPLLLANGIVAFLPDPSGTTDVVTTLVVRSVGEGILESAVGLLLVELCYRLIAADRAAARRGTAPVVTRSR